MRIIIKNGRFRNADPFLLINWNNKHHGVRPHITKFLLETFITSSATKWTQDRTVEPQEQWIKSNMCRNDWKTKNQIKTLILETLSMMKCSQLIKHNYPRNIITLWESMKNNPAHIK